MMRSDGRARTQLRPRRDRIRESAGSVTSRNPCTARLGSSRSRPRILLPPGELEGEHVRVDEDEVRRNRPPRPRYASRCSVMPPSETAPARRRRRATTSGEPPRARPAGNRDSSSLPEARPDRRRNRDPGLAASVGPLRWHQSAFGPAPKLVTITAVSVRSGSIDDPVVPARCPGGTRPRRAPRCAVPAGVGLAMSQACCVPRMEYADGSRAGRVRTGGGSPRRQCPSAARRSRSPGARPGTRRRGSARSAKPSRPIP